MSTLTLINDTSEVVRVATFKKPVLNPTLNSIAWRIDEPPPNGGQTVIQIPQDYQVYANYSFDPNERNDPDAGNRTAIINFAEYTARFLVQSATSQDQRASAATITQVFTDLVMNEVRIENSFGYGVWGHVTKDGDDVYAPQVIWPGGVLMEDIRSSFYLAVVAQFVYKGDRLVDEEISLTETEVLEGGTATVTGSMWEGYQISVTE
ncbi:MAG TPA: hypothetical protein VLV83_11805 [Acidobacteriota bacterium]|nr:hypothetical protein [Acidobacteriota bacterium]